MCESDIFILYALLYHKSFTTNMNFTRGSLGVVKKPVNSGVHCFLPKNLLLVKPCNKCQTFNQKKPCKIGTRISI